MKITLEPAPLQEPEIIIKGQMNSPQVRAILDALQNPGGTGRLFLHREEREYPVAPEEISYFEAQGNRVWAHVQGEAYEARYKLYALCKMLRDQGFVQISKGVVANIAHIESVAAEFSGNYTAFLKDGKTRLTISRKYMKDFRHYVMEVKHYV